MEDWLNNSISNDMESLGPQDKELSAIAMKKDYCDGGWHHLFLCCASLEGRNLIKKIRHLKWLHFKKKHNGSNNS